ncbi:MAG: hypothetical protein LAN62_01280 [Acidobacteriia bacterium]|nr:hypothetical protein [Terriglobia bacterium]
MTRPARYFHPGQLQFITSSTYRGLAQTLAPEGLRSRAAIFGHELEAHGIEDRSEDASLRENADPPQSGGLRQPGRYRVWQRRFYPFNVYSDRKRLEKLHYMHGNPVQRGLVSSPDQWPWSSFRYYHLNDASVLAMDRLG